MNFNAWRPALYRMAGTIGAFSALSVVALFAAGQASISIPGGGWRDLLPLPGLYFLEIAGLSVLAALVTWRSVQPQPAWQAGMPWGTAGVLLAFVILGAWTIGFFLIPAFLCFLATGFLDPNLRRGQIPGRLGMFAGIGLMQALLIIFMVVISAS